MLPIIYDPTPHPDIDIATAQSLISQFSMLPLLFSVEQFQLIAHIQQQQAEVIQQQQQQAEAETATVSSGTVAATEL